MRILMLVLPVALLMAYSQIAIKWRMIGFDDVNIHHLNLFSRMLKYLSDPVIISAYVAALLASFLWLYVITKMPLVVGFPVYIGITFILVILGGTLFLSESVSVSRIMSVLLILVGVIIGIRS